MKRIMIAVLMVSAFNTLAFAEERGRRIETGITLEKAIEIATKDVPGRVLEAEFEKGVYEVKISTKNGERIKVKIDPRDGTILRKGRVVKVTNGIGK